MIRLLLLVCILRCAKAQGLNVSIQSNPDSEPYPAAIWIGLKAIVTGNLSSVTYNWTLLCSKDDPLTTVTAIANHTNAVRIWSTPPFCADTFICNVSDLNGNIGSAHWRVGQVTGVGLWADGNPLLNASAMQADEVGNINAVNCHSSSFKSNVGRWISSQGDDITVNFLDPFTIQFNNGPGYPSFNIFKLQNPTSQPFTSTYNGVFSCIIQDSEGVVHTLHVGIYSDEYSDGFEIERQNLGLISTSPLTLNCPTIGLPPTLVLWNKGRQELSTGGTYEITTHLKDRPTTAFDNYLHINLSPHRAEGLYLCFAGNALDGPAMNSTINTADHFIGVYILGSDASISCNFILGSWSNENGSVVGNSQLDIPTANETIHNKTFSCSGLSRTTLEPTSLRVAIFVTVPPTSVIVSAISDDREPILGQSYSMVCTGSVVVGGLSTRPSPQWITASGGPLSSDVQVQGPNLLGQTSVELVALFPVLWTSHSGSYICRITLHSQALNTLIIKNETFEITIQISPPTVSIAVLSSEPHTAGGSLVILCVARVSPHTDTPVSVTFTWKVLNRRSLNSTTNPRVAISNATFDGQRTYQSMLKLNDLSIEQDSNLRYFCEVSLKPASQSPYLLPSTPTSSNTYLLMVTDVSISVTVSPSQVSVTDRPPSNSFVLTCTAVSSLFTALAKVFSWCRQPIGRQTCVELVHNGGSIIITNSDLSSQTSISELRASENQSGGYVYKCSVRFENKKPYNASATVSVQGPTRPLAAVDLSAKPTGFSSATVMWRIPHVAYTPEMYMVIYGRNQRNLSRRSDVIAGIPNATHYAIELIELEHNTRYYYKVQSNNSVGRTESDTHHFDIKDANVTISINDSQSGNVSPVGGMFTLICTVVELTDHSGDTLVSWRDPNGRQIMTGGDFIVTREVSPQRVEYSLRFNPSRASHSGTYTCSVDIPDVGYSGLETFDVRFEGGNLGVIIETKGSRHVGERLVLLCQLGSTSGVVGALMYKWTSTCSGECFVQGNASSISTDFLRATDSGTHTCTVTDSVGNVGSASVAISATGVTLYHSTDGLITNNSVVRATDGFLSGIIFCLSGRRQAGIGQWIAPNGEDYTQPGVHPFHVTLGGDTNPGVVNISLGPSGRFPAGQWNGVYACVIPDKNGTIQYLHLGIYIVFNLPPLPSVVSLTASSVGLYRYFTLNCTTSGSAASQVTWEMDGIPLEDDGLIYDFIQILREGTTSTYDNLLISYVRSVNDYSGNYTCAVRNNFGDSSRQTTFHGIRVSQHSVLILGSAVNITCSSDLGVNSIEWVKDGQVQTSSQGSHGVLAISSVRDSDYQSQYTCRSRASFGIQEHTIVLQTEVDPVSALTVRINASSTIPEKGEEFTLTCTATKSSLIKGTLTVTWYDEMGNQMINSATDGVTISNLVESGMEFKRSIIFKSLDISHSREYRCNATVQTTSPPFTITKEAIWDLIVQPCIDILNNSVSCTNDEDNHDIEQSVEHNAAAMGAGLAVFFVAVVITFIIVVVIIVALLYYRRSRTRRNRKHHNVRQCHDDVNSVSGMSVASTRGLLLSQPKNRGRRRDNVTGVHGSSNPATVHTNNGPPVPPRNDQYQASMNNSLYYDYATTISGETTSNLAVRSGLSTPQHKGGKEQLKSAADPKYLTLINDTDEQEKSVPSENPPSENATIASHSADALYCNLSNVVLNLEDSNRNADP